MYIIVQQSYYKSTCGIKIPKQVTTIISTKYDVLCSLRRQSIVSSYSIKMIESTLITYFFSPIISFIRFFYKFFSSDGFKTKHLHVYVKRLNEARQCEIQRLKEIIKVFINIF